jgi:hypothetical protein
MRAMLITIPNRRRRFIVVADESPFFSRSHPKHFYQKPVLAVYHAIKPVSARRLLVDHNEVSGERRVTKNRDATVAAVGTKAVSVLGNVDDGKIEGLFRAV